MPPRLPAPATTTAAARCCRAAAAALSSSTAASSVFSPAPLSMHALGALLGRLSLSTAAPLPPRPSSSPSTTTTTTPRHRVRFTTPHPSAAQVRHASIVGTLRNNPGAVKRRTRVGRGPSSGHGKTSGRGHKGTGQRGKVNPWFQGGQTPLIVTKGAMGEESIRVPRMAEVNLDDIQARIDQGRLDPSRPITPKELIECRLARVKDGVKILARNGRALRQPIDVMVSRASAAAIAAIEREGGSIVTRYYTKDSIRRLLAGESVNTDRPLPVGEEHVADVLSAMHGPDGRRLYRLPDPSSRDEIEYYRDPKNRGYMSTQLAPGQTPSLFHRVPKVMDDAELARVMKVRLQHLRARNKTRKQEAKLF
jgi:ribosomal protein L15